MPTVTAPYTLDNAWAQARRRLELIETCYDRSTIRHLETLGVRSGWRCLEVGGGSGSITRWLCSAVGTEGHVTAIDIDTRFLEEIDADNLDVLRLDVTTADLPRQAFDLIHTRAVLIHLPTREQVLDRLIAALRPGGCLFLEEPDRYPIEALGSGLYRQTWEALFSRLSRAGMDLAWARALPVLLHSRGLAGVEADSELRFVEGGSPDADFQRLTVSQLRETDLTRGIPAEQLDAWDALLNEPGQWFPGPALVAARGWRTAAPT